AKGIAGLTGRAGREHGIGSLVGLDRVSNCTVVKRTSEVGGHTEDATSQHSRMFLINILAAGVELAHRVPVDHVNVSVFTCAHGEMPDVSGAIGEIGHPPRSSRAEIGVGGILLLLILHLEVVRYGEPARSGNLQEGVAVVAVAGKSTGVEGGTEITVAIEEINIPRAVRGRSGVRHPDCAFAAVGDNVEDRALG